jgi:G:T/U-mismatch repair DNA glycosylase
MKFKTLAQVKNKQAQYTPADEDSFVAEQLFLDRKSKNLGMRQRGPSGKIKSRRRQIQELGDNPFGVQDEFDHLLEKTKKEDLQEMLQRVKTEIRERPVIAGSGKKIKKAEGTEVTGYPDHSPEITASKTQKFKILAQIKKSQNNFSLLNEQQLRQQIQTLENKIRLFDQYGVNRYSPEETENDPLTEQIYEDQTQLSLLRDEVRRRKATMGVVTSAAFTVPSSPEADATIGNIEEKIGRRLQQSERNEIIYTFNNVGTEVVTFSGPRKSVKAWNNGKFQIQ